MNTQSVLRTGVALVLLAVAGCSNEGGEAPAAPTAAAPAGLAWAAQGDNWAEEKAKLQALGEQFDSSEAMYEKLKADAGGGKPLTWEQMALPAYDWSGVYTRSKGGLSFDPDVDAQEGPTSAKLTPEAQAVVDAPHWKRPAANTTP